MMKEECDLLSIYFDKIVNKLSETTSMTWDLIIFLGVLALLKVFAWLLSHKIDEFDRKASDANLNISVSVMHKYWNY